MRTLAITLALTLAACDVEEADFAESAATAYCSQLHQCARSSYDDQYDDRDDCIDDWEEAVDLIADIADAFGDYDEDAGTECVNSIRTEPCEDWNEGTFPPECDADLVYGG